MRSLCLALLILGALAAPGHADEGVKIAVGVNPWFRWAHAGAIGISAYAGITDHQAIRANFATYEYEGPSSEILAAVAMEGEGLYMGRIVDVGVGWMYFPRRLWSGPSLEAGLLRRARDTYSRNEYDEPQVADTKTASYCGRALVGWSWLFADHVFISIAAGLSVGYETGRETTGTVEGPSDMDVTRDVGRSDVSGELFLRFGGALGL